MKKLLLSALVMVGLTSLGVADDHNGEELFKEKCISCHLIYKPEDMSQIKAPPLQMMVWKLGKTFNHDPEKFEAHINDFVLNPTIEKALCPAVKRFGVMPSLEGKITKEELAVIAEWIVENF